MTCPCGKALGPKNRSGLCQRCATIKFNTTDERRAQVSATMKRRYQIDPNYRARNAAILREINNRPEVKAAKSEAMRQARTWEHAYPLMGAGSLARRRAARAISETLMGWCPFELRAEYRKLIASKKIPASEAREIILAQHEAEMARFRRKCMGEAA